MALAEPAPATPPRGSGAISTASACPQALRSEPLPEPPLNPGATPLLPNPAQAAKAAPVAATAVPSSPSDPAPPLPPDYRQRLRPTPLGWPILKSWCVWVEPVGEAQASDRWQRQWSEAVDQALDHWATVLPLQRVASADAAQIQLLRRRPRRQPGPDGRLRASHGRAVLSLRLVDRGQGLRLEPLVEVSVSLDQRQEALQATALHELGHAVGLWGHSEDGRDVMAAKPGPQPILRLSPRDRATVIWLYSQPTAFGQPLPLPSGAEAGNLDAARGSRRR